MRAATQRPRRPHPSPRFAPSVRALSIRQPYVQAILGEAADGRPIGKRVENRDWAGCRVRGTVLIHASKTCTGAAYASGAAHISAVLEAEGREVEVPPLAELPQGGIVGIARIVAVRRHPPAWGLDGSPRSGLPEVCSCEKSNSACKVCGGTGIRGGWLLSWGWAQATALGLELADVRRLEFVPYKGQRGFFPVPVRALPLSYQVAAQELDEAERQRRKPSPRGLWLLGAAAGNGTGCAEDRRPGVVVVPPELEAEAAKLRDAGLLERGPTPRLAQITQDGLRAWRDEE